jgi:formylglycine-generating enzyme required for sulfatase activity
LYRVNRGGCWADGPVDVRSTYRNWNAPDLRFDNLGFRAAL